MTDPQTLYRKLRLGCCVEGEGHDDSWNIKLLAAALTEAETRGFERGLAESERQLTKACKQAINNAMKYYTSPTLEAP